MHEDKHESLLQIDTTILMGIVKHSQSSQNSKLAMSLLFLKQEVEDEVDFLYVHRQTYQSFLQVDFNTSGIKFSLKVILSLLMGMIRHSQSTQSNKFAVSLQYLEKKLGIEFIFCMQINIKIPSKLLLIMVYKISNTFTINK